MHQGVQGYAAGRWRTRSDGPCVGRAVVKSLSGALTWHGKLAAPGRGSRRCRAEECIDQAGLAVPNGWIASEPVISHRPAASVALAVAAAIDPRDCVGEISELLVCLVYEVVKPIGRRRRRVRDRVITSGWRFLAGRCQREELIQFPRPPALQC